MSGSYNEEDLYSISWSNPAWSHLLCTANVLDYFCDLSNPFYDRQCNNEVIRMQRLNSEQLLCMTGVEFYLYQAQEPVLFIIRKQHRLSSTQVTPLAYYYIINGTVLQAPDLFTLLHSRLLTTVNGLNKILQSLLPCARFHPSDGSYSWDDPNILLGLANDSDTGSDSTKSEPVLSPAKSENTTATSLFQIQRTDLLLSDWANRFPLPSAAFHNQAALPQAKPTPNSAGISQSSPGQSTSSHIATITIKEEPTITDSNPSQSKAAVKVPFLPGVGPHFMPVPATTAFPQSPQTNKKHRVS